MASARVTAPQLNQEQSPFSTSPSWRRLDHPTGHNRFRREQRDEAAAKWTSEFPDRAAYMLGMRLPPRDKIPILEAAAAAARQIGDRRAEGGHLGNLGLAYADLGEVRRAIEYYEQALAISREIGDRRGEGNDLGNLGIAYKNLGEVRRAIEYCEQALSVAREIGDRRMEGNALANLGLLAKGQGDLARARQLWEQALDIYEAIEDPNAERVRGWLDELAGASAP